MVVTVRRGIARVLMALGVATALLAGAGPGAATASPGTAAATRASDALIARLAVLRRPQTPADVLPTAPHLANSAGRIIPSLTRLVAVEPAARLFVVVTTPACGRLALWSPTLGDQVAIVVVTAQGDSETTPVPAVDLTNADEIDVAGPPPPRRGQSGDAYDAMIVPDGVTRVRWTFGNAAGRPVVTIEPSVADNVAVAPLTRHRGVLLLHTTWYAADGTVVPTSDRAFKQALAAQQAAIKARIVRYDARHSHRAAPALLADFAVFDIHSRSGVRLKDGTRLSHPRLSAVPLPILELMSPIKQPRLDLEQIRQVTFRSGVRVWIIPGARGMCLATLDQSRLPNVYGTGSAASCTDSLARAESQGTGFSSGFPGGATVICGVVPRTMPTVTISLGHHKRRTIRPVDGVYIVRRPGHTKPGQAFVGPAARERSLRGSSLFSLSR